MYQDDRRIFDRFEVDFNAKIQDMKGQEASYAECCDVSAGGLGLVTAKRLQPNKHMEIWLGIPDGKEPFHGLGKVVWSKQVQEDKWRSGFEFQNVDFMGLRRAFAMVPGTA